MLVQIRVGQFRFIQQGKCRVGKVGFGQVLLVSLAGNTVIFSLLGG